MKKYKLYVILLMNIENIIVGEDNMKRVFLSHSSEDKQSYLDLLVKKLEADKGRERFVYDKITFEQGLENEQLIVDWLKNSDLFVLFLSNNSLNSSWVKKEIFEAKDLFDKGVISKIYPIIIDPNITHEDDRIPEWMKSTYNLRLVKKPAIAARKIINRMTEISWEQNPALKNRQQFFVGRNDLMEQLEARLDSYDKESPNILIATGMSDVGRRTFLKHGLSKLNIVSESYSMPVIKLDAHQSIEDFIQFIIDFGISDISLDGLNLGMMSQENKIDLSLRLLQEIKEARDIILIIDDGAIIAPTRKVSPWFLGLSRALQKISADIHICVVSKFRTNISFMYSEDSIFSIHIPALSLNERRGLFKRYSKLIGLDLDSDDMKYLSDLFSGLPNEIIYTCSVIEENGIDYVKQHTELITDYADKKVSEIIIKYDKDLNAKALLALLALFDFVSYELLYNIIGKNTKYDELLKEFFAQGMYENIGSNGEYIVLNTAIKNYVSRQRFPLIDEFEEGIKKHVKDFVINYDQNTDGRDVSDVFFSLKESLIRGETLRKDSFIPSHYLKSMKELYDKRNKDSEVIKLADIILEQEEFMDAHIIREIRYFLCSSLARMKNERFKKEVQNIEGPEHDFLFGFYYRHVGQDEKAVQRLNGALDQRKNFSRAKRELVTVYNSMEEYDKAYLLSKENYEGNRSNEYHIQAYFQALLLNKELKIEVTEKRRILKQLLKDINAIESEKAKNMYLTMGAQYNLLIEKNIDEAKQLVDEALINSPDDIYVLLCQFDVYEKANDLKKLKETIALLKKNSGNTQSKYYKEYKKRQVIYLAKIGQIEDARQITMNLSVSENSKNILLQRISKIDSDTRFN
ncbi:TIR domain-containing protein [Lactococcus petauri]|uniref:toll/interleukin-1 receptor domain-containing protein n=2 Tax=Lactococcus petauri TaxID=1940789 RepID=UPI0038542CE9